MEGVKHSTQKHALLSASGASRWLNCTPSARLEEKYQVSTGSSSYAEEGTLAHELADVRLRFFNGEITDKTQNAEVRKLHTRIKKFYHKQNFKGQLLKNVKSRLEDLVKEMESEVQKYLDFVIERTNLARAQYGEENVTLLIEKRLDFSHVVEGGFGTGDVTLITPEYVDVIDLKFGKGVQVFAEENSQLMLYGLGALDEFELLYDLQFISLTIVQPRLNHTSNWRISVTELTKWAEEKVKPAAMKAHRGEGLKQVGDWCRWCKVKPICRAFADHNLELAKFDFLDADQLTDKEIVEIYSRLPMLQDWANSISEHMKQTALDGKKWDGYKVVEGRSNRAWTDEKAVSGVLSDLGHKEEEYSKISVLGIAKIEKLVGQEDFEGKLQKYVIKPEGKPTLVEESDSRPALGSAESAKKDFENI